MTDCGPKEPLLATLTLRKGGPLPAYHPRMLRALLEADRLPAASATLRAVLTWLQSQSEPAEVSGTHVDAFLRCHSSSQVVMLLQDCFGWAVWKNAACKC